MELILNEFHKVVLYLLLLLLLLLNATKMTWIVVKLSKYIILGWPLHCKGKHRRYYPALVDLLVDRFGGIVIT